MNVKGGDLGGGDQQKQGEGKERMLKCSMCVYI
jgi:hypothetical protein